MHKVVARNTLPKLLIIKSGGKCLPRGASRAGKRLSAALVLGVCRLPQMVAGAGGALLPQSSHTCACRAGEGDESKNRWQKYTEELSKKDLNDMDTLTMVWSLT